MRFLGKEEFLLLIPVFVFIKSEDGGMGWGGGIEREGAYFNVI